jgi:hypothetical protein
VARNSAQTRPRARRNGISSQLSVKRKPNTGQSRWKLCQSCGLKEKVKRVSTVLSAFAPSVPTGRQKCGPTSVS